jgi:hypothetical protein
MRTFMSRQTVTAAAIGQAPDPIQKRAILQNFNLSRGRVYPAGYACARGCRHTPVEELNYLNYMYLYKQIRDLMTTGQPELSRSN